MPIPADQIDPDARKVIRRLVRHNYQAYLVGGCVRDLLLGRSPKDFDIATSATPNEVKALFRNCRIIGRRFRLAHIFFGPKIIETATFRANPRDGEVVEASDEEGDGLGAPESRPESDILIRRDNVFGTAEEDARRRDFTINGLFYDIDPDEVIDYVGGLSDLAARTVRTIGDPEIRFREDPVRILRAIKFAARLSFDVDPAAWQAIKDHQGEIPKCAPPRILEEIYRLLRGGAARRSMEILRDTGVLDLLIPDVADLLRERADSQEARWLWQVLDRLDTEREPVPTNAVLLCALLGPFLGESVFDDSPPSSAGPRRDVSLVIEERTRPMLEHMRVSRRDVERARQILIAQRRLSSAKKRRGKAPPVKRRDYVEEAIHVQQLVGQVIRPDEATLIELQRWREQTESGVEVGVSVQVALPGLGGETSEERPGRRRRRRGGRRFRREDGTTTETDTAGDEDDLDETPATEAASPASSPHPAEQSALPSETVQVAERDADAGAATNYAEPAKPAHAEPAKPAHAEPAKPAHAEPAKPAGDAAKALHAPDVDQTSAAPPSTGSTTPER